MADFEEWRNGYLAEPLNELEERRLQDAYEAGRTAETFAANSRLGDIANEGMKAQRLEVAISKLSARYPTKDEAEYLREVIAEAQG